MCNIGVLHFPSTSLLPLWDQYKGMHPPSASFTLKMAAAFYAERLEQIKYTTLINPEYTTGVEVVRVLFCNSQSDPS
jgi:hypothetical protein